MNPVLVALDFIDKQRAVEMAEATREHVGGFKVGLRLMLNEGPQVIGDLSALGLPVFADAKLHDIPDQVGDAAARLAAHGARWVTVHATGGETMVRAAVDGARAGSGDNETGILAVTVLTSLDESDLREIGLAGPVRARALELVKLAARSGAEGFVSSPREVAALKTEVPELLAVTPGIRTGRSTDDQKRTATPQLAIASGADLLVVGRSITAAPDPVAAAAEIARSIGSAAL